MTAIATIGLTPRAGVTPPGTTVTEWVEQWLAGRTGTVAVTTAVRHESMVRRHVAGDLVLGPMALADVDRAVLVDYFARLAAVPNGRGETLAPKTRKHVHRALRQLLDDAVAEGLIARNPMQRLRAPRQRAIEVAYFEPDEVRALIDGRHTHRWGRIYALGALTGMRRGELCGLQWPAVNATAAQIEVLLTRTTAGGAIILGDPKTDRSHRLIDLPDIAVTTVEESRDALLDDRTTWGSDWNDDGDLWCARNEDGSLPHPDRLGDEFRAYCRALGISELGLHGLRHTFAAASIRAGVDVYTLSRRLGHSTVSTTLDVYGHLWPGQGASAAAAMAGAMGY